MCIYADEFERTKVYNGKYNSMVKQRIEILTEPKNARPELAGLRSLGEQYDALMPRATKFGKLVTKAEELSADIQRCSSGDGLE